MNQSSFSVGGKSCIAFNESIYQSVRSYFGVVDSFVAESTDFSFDDLGPSGGKGGNLLAFSNDGKFVIKELNPDDNKQLSDVNFCNRLSSHVTNPDNPSLLAPILTHFQLEDSNRRFIVTLNILRYDGSFHKIYDLKGCADDRLIVNDGSKIEVVRKRIWSLHVWFGCGGPDRRVYKDGKLEALHNPYIPLDSAYKQSVMKAIEYDVKFLQQFKLMDYSLLVGVLKIPKADASLEEISSTDLKPDIALYSGKPLIVKDSDYEEGYQIVSYVGIIDYLQPWTPAKAIARAIKVLERNKATVLPQQYGDRFIEHFDHVLLEMDRDLEEQYERRDLRARSSPHRCFPLEKH